MAKQWHPNTPSIKGWRLYFEAMAFMEFRVGFDFRVGLDGEEDSDISFWLYLPGLGVGFGAENNPY